jgi:dihydroorotase
MIHIGVDEGGKLAEETGGYTQELLPLLEKGDILSHVFTWKKGGIFKDDGSVLPELKEAAQRGVVLDVCHGKRNFSFKTAKILLDKGIVPDTISTDLNNMNLNGPVFSLVVTMSKFIALGFTVDEVVKMTTINPARALNEEDQKGSLKVGMPADISMLEIVEGDYCFSAGDGADTLKGDRLIVPKVTIKSGLEIPAQSMGYLPPSP